jgi:hypothetical protein
LLAVVNNAAADVALFKVSGSGLTPSGSPVTTGANSGPVDAAFSPSGGLLATANYASENLSLFSVGMSGLTPVGSPIPDSPGLGPQAVAFAGGLLAVANSASHNLSLYSVSPAGLTAITGSPFSDGAGYLNALAFGPKGLLLATVATASDSVSLFALAGPSATISTPAANATYTQNQQVRAGVSCNDASGGPGITACTGSTANGSAIDTTTSGIHTFTATATSASGQTATTTSTYTVLAPAIAGPPPPVVGTQPTVTSVHQSHTVWRGGRRMATASRIRRPPVGTSFAFTLNENATVALTFTQRTAGRRVKGRCSTNTHGRHAPACRLRLTRGVLSITGHTGTNRVLFQGRISKSTQLKPGGYTVTIIATNSRGQRSAPRSLRFTIVQ